MFQSINAVINDQKAETRGVLLTGSEVEMAHYQDNDKKLEELFSQMVPLLTSDRGKQIFGEMRQASDQYHVVLMQAMQTYQAGKHKEAANLLFSPRVTELRSTLGKATSDLAEVADKLASNANSQQRDAQSNALFWTVTLACIGIAVGIGIATLIARGISSSVTAMADALSEIASNNLAAPDVVVATEDEVGQASLALNKMKNNLRQLIQSIAGTAEHVASASEEISSSASQQAQSAETQKDQAAQVATAMQEMSSTVLQVSENSNKAAEASNKAAETARHGGEIVEETLSKMRAIADSVSGTAKKMEELGKSSDQIGRIAGVIDDIADQTNLLALNAAIEAARAGEQGRGFAVVADEVRKLAERTTTATKEIAQMIQNIQDETKTAVTAMEEGTRQVDDGVNSTAQAGNSLKEIIHMSEQVGEMITHIATAATEQSSASEEVNNNMDRIAKLVKESAEGAQQSAKACQDLSGLALDLQKLVANFKLGDGAAGKEIFRQGAPENQGEKMRGPLPGGRSGPKALAAAAH